MGAIGPADAGAPAALLSPDGLVSLFALLLLAGCARGPASGPPPELAPPVELAALRFSPAGEAQAAPDWWAVFENGELSGLVEHALDRNLTVRGAFARLEAAEALVVQARSPLFPALQAEAGAGVATDAAPEATVGLGLSYELDLWGRIRAEARGAAERRSATAADAQAAALSLSGQVARAWVGLTATRAQLALLDRQVHANQGMFEVVDARFRNGVVRQADALRQQRLLVQTEGQRIVQLESLEVQEHALLVLLGRPATETLALDGAALPELPPLPVAGLPLEVVRRRPDVRAAERRLYAADADVAVAVASRLPRLSLGAGVSTTVGSGVDPLSGWVASLSANLVAPLFEAGARRAAVREQEALLRATLADYGAVLLGAVQEIEDALARDRRQGERVANLEAQARLADRTAAGLEAQYTGGLDVSYLDVLTAQTTAQQLRRDLIAARQRQLELRIAVYLAIAGPVPLPETSP
jgi:NodT family efflux transporter outer membrane factor (OMF) lipoprotein